MNNIRLLCKKRDSNIWLSIGLIFVVQTRNYREMPAFVDLGKELGVDSVQFQLIDHWSRAMDGADYQQEKIWDPSHPEFNDFIKILQDKRFDDPIVQMGNVASLRHAETPPAS